MWILALWLACAGPDDTDAPNGRTGAEGLEVVLVGDAVFDGVAEGQLVLYGYDPDVPDQGATELERWVFAIEALPHTELLELPTDPHAAIEADAPLTREEARYYISGVAIDEDGDASADWLQDYEVTGPVTFGPDLPSHLEIALRPR